MADPTLGNNVYVAFTTSTASSTYVDLGAVRELGFPLDKAQLADGVMGDTLEVFFQGLKSAPIDIRCRQDFTTAAIGVDKKMYNLWNGGTAFKIKMRPVNSAVAATNPSYLLSRVRVFGLTPISAKHGDLLDNAVKVMPCTGCTLTRSTST